MGKRKIPNYSYDVTLIRTNLFRVLIGLGVKQARPHLILLLKEKRQKITIYDFDPSRFNNFIQTIKKTFSEFKQSIFSLHLGFYQSKECPHFHAHFILDINDYIKIVARNYQKIEKGFLKELEEWPYRLLEEGQKYKTLDIKTIYNLKDSKNNGLPTISKNYSIIFHHDQPRIGFIPNKSGPNHNNLRDLIIAMMEFINNYKLQDKKVGGCHLCIQNNLWIDKQFKLPGFIQIDPFNFYKINPNRNKWLENFKESNYLVLT
tara:strand:- start:7607 stop:8389 length:783 start_codon:yes stop_codon:yes gene_type:complete